MTGMHFTADKTSNDFSSIFSIILASTDTNTSTTISLLLLKTSPVLDPKVEQPPIALQQHGSPCDREREAILKQTGNREVLRGRSES